MDSSIKNSQDNLSDILADKVSRREFIAAVLRGEKTLANMDLQALKEVLVELSAQGRPHEIR